MKKVWITAYDVFSATISQKARVDAILVGDSLGMTVYGFDSTQSVTREMMRQHFVAVQKAAPDMRIILDIPFQCDTDLITFLETLEFFAEVGAKEFKLELCEDNVHCLLEARSRGFAMVAHLGYLPQSGESARVVGRNSEESNRIFSLAKKADILGVSSIVLECVPEDLAQKISESVQAEVIGIGAGRFVDGQVLVFDDVVGKTDSGFTPKFLRRFGNAREHILNAVIDYSKAVRMEEFPLKTEVYE